MREFHYERAASPSAAVAAVTAADTDTVYLGGGTNLVDLMKLGVARPSRVVDVSGLPLDGLQTLPGGGLLIGAAVRNSVLGSDPQVRHAYPALSQALLAGASGQIRNMATVGGNLLQRTRCGYFNDIAKPCNKREPGTGCPARTGVHRDLAIIGHSAVCIATHPSDMAVALSALDARVHVLGSDGTRVVQLDELYRLPGDSPKWDTTLRHGDLITGVELPPPSGLTRRSMYRKARDRASYAFAAGAVAAAVTVTDGTVDDVRISFGAIAPRPWRARIAEQELVGRPADARHIGAALDLELVHARPFPDNAFKVPLSRRLAVSALLGLIGGPR
ncbi:MAG: xanthine dehydrogenase family protein subunit M [Nakamurella sp.]